MMARDTLPMGQCVPIRCLHEFANYFTEDIGDAAVDSVVAIREALVVDAKLIQHRRMQVITIRGLVGDFVGPLIT
jgi:hypothetical protein